jgi:hypothetical protein
MSCGIGSRTFGAAPSLAPSFKAAQTGELNAKNDNNKPAVILRIEVHRDPVFWAPFIVVVC